jgi:hypothetical protein
MVLEIVHMLGVESASMSSWLMKVAGTNEGPKWVAGATCRPRPQFVDQHTAKYHAVQTLHAWISGAIVNGEEVNLVSPMEDDRVLVPVIDGLPISAPPAAVVLYRMKRLGYRVRYDVLGLQISVFPFLGFRQSCLPRVIS